MVAAARLSLSQRLAAALPYHYRQDRKFRESHRDLVRDFAGLTTYPAFIDGLSGGELAAKKQIINLTMQAAQAFVMNMAAGRPRFLTTPCHPRYAAGAAKMRRALDRYSKQLYLEETLQDYARNSWFSTGIVKVYQSGSAAVGADADPRMSAGWPYAQSISIKKVCRDTDAECPEEASFLADLYSMRYSDALKSPRFGRKARAFIKECGVASDDDETERELGNGSRQHTIEDRIYLCDVFVRSRNEVRTYLCTSDFTLRAPKDGSKIQPLQRVPWTGEECGPYYFLNMGAVPGYFWASSPGINQVLLQQFTNTVYRKLEDQARRHKVLGTAANAEDATEAMKLRDGEWGTFGNPEGIGNIRLDGPDQSMFGLFINNLQQYSRVNGNLDNKMGLGASADTASQERMIGAMVNRMEAYYQNIYVSSVRKIAKGLSRLVWYDANLRIPGTFQVPNTDIVVQDDWLPITERGDRMGTFEQYEIDVDPYSMPYQSPAQRLNFIDSQVSKFLPALPFLSEQGIRFNAPRYFEAMADYGNAPEIREIFQANQPPMSADGPQHNRTLPIEGQHEYIYRSAGGGSQDPNAAAMSMFASAEANNDG